MAAHASPAPGALAIVAERLPHATVIHLRGDLDATTSPRVLATLCAQPDALPVVLDLAGVAFVDSTGLRLLLDAARARPGELVLARPSPIVAYLLGTAGIRGAIPEAAGWEVQEVRAALRAGTG